MVIAFCIESPPQRILKKNDSKIQQGDTQAKRHKLPHTLAQISGKEMP
jgi:hypothetical protein